MPNSDHKDFYIRNTSHPNYKDTVFVEEDLLTVILQKLEMLIFSNKGDLLGDSNLGSNLGYYLWSTKVPSSEIRRIMVNQISTYIPELETMGYSLVVDMYEGDVRDIMYLRFKIKGYNINFVID